MRLLTARVFRAMLPGVRCIREPPRHNPYPVSRREWVGGCRIIGNVGELFMILRRSIFGPSVWGWVVCFLMGAVTALAVAWSISLRRPEMRALTCGFIAREDFVVIVHEYAGTGWNQIDHGVLGRRGGDEAARVAEQVAVDMARLIGCRRQLKK